MKGHLMPITARVAVTARPSDVGPQPPRFQVGAEVSVPVRGVVVEVYEDERRVRSSSGELRWYAADQLVSVTAKRRRGRVGWRAGC